MAVPRLSSIVFFPRYEVRKGTPAQTRETLQGMRCRNDHQVRRSKFNIEQPKLSCATTLSGTRAKQRQAKRAGTKQTGIVPHAMFKAVRQKKKNEFLPRLIIRARNFRFLPIKYKCLNPPYTNGSGLFSCFCGEMPF